MIFAWNKLDVLYSLVLLNIVNVHPLIFLSLSSLYLF